VKIACARPLQLPRASSVAVAEQQVAGLWRTAKNSAAQRRLPQADGRDRRADPAQL